MKTNFRFINVDGIHGGIWFRELRAFMFNVPSKRMSPWTAFSFVETCESKARPFYSIHLLYNPIQSLNVLLDDGLRDVKVSP